MMAGSTKARKLIVGVDPGLNCGLAILALDGTPILVESHREWPLSKIVERIRELGEPTIISSDVSPAPGLLEKLSRKLNAILFEPAIPMSSEEKHKLSKAYVERYGINVENVHEVDALAAAIKAFQRYKSKFEQAEAKLREEGCDLPPDDVKDLVARGYSIANAIRILKGEEDAKRAPAPIGKATTQNERLEEVIRRLTGKLMLERERNRLLREANRELQTKVRELEGKIETLREALERARSEQIAQIKRDREYQRLIDEVRVLRGRLADLEAQVESYRQMMGHLQHLSDVETKGGLTLLKPVESFTREGLERACKLFNIRVGDIVFILEPSGGGPTTAESLAKRGIKAVITRGAMSHQALEVFEKYHVPVLPAEKVDIRWIDGLPYADVNEIKRLIKEGEDLGSINDVERLKSIIDDHLREIREKRA